MTETARLRLPILAAAQAQKHVTHNEALTALDTLVQASVIDKDLTAPPGSPAEGDCYIVAGGGGTATGDWTGWEKRIARYQDGQWISFLPGAGDGEGWLVWVMDEDAMYRFDGTNWGLAGIEGPEGPAGPQGQGIEPDATGTLAQRAAYDGEAQGFVYLRTDVSPFELYVKASGASGDWAGPSPLGGGAADFVDLGDVPASYSGQAGKLVAVKGAEDGLEFAARREKLAANRTYYVSTAGSDSNDGLSAGAPFLTIQKAWDVTQALDLAGYTVTIQLADGTYTAGLNATSGPVGGGVKISGNAANPENVIVSTTSANAIYLAAAAKLTLEYFEIRTTTSGWGARSSAPGAELTIGAGMRFGACANGQIAGSSFGLTKVTADYAIVGGAQYALYCNITGQIVVTPGITVTLSGTPAFSSAFAAATQLSYLWASTVTFSGGATGKRYDAQLNAVIYTSGGGASYFPGNSAGTTATGGQYA